MRNRIVAFIVFLSILFTFLPASAFTEENVVQNTTPEILVPGNNEVIANKPEEIPSLVKTQGVNPIIKEPVDCTTKIPESAKFSVEVDNPTEYTFQWQFYVEGLNQWDDLRGPESQTPELFFSITSYKNDNDKYRCIVTDASGTSYISNEASIILTNIDTIGAYLIVCGVGISPGETKIFGEGTISLSEDGDTITLDNATAFQKQEDVKYHVDESQGCINYNNLREQPKELNLIVKGTNTLTTLFRDPYGGHANGSNTVMSYPNSPKNIPDLVITGDTLKLFGGEIGIRSGSGGSEDAVSNVTIDADVTLGTARDEFSTGILSHNFVLKSGKNLTVDRTNSALVAYGNITFEPNSTSKLTLTPKPINVTNTEVGVLECLGTLMVDQATVEASVKVLEEHFPRQKRMLLTCMEIGELNIQKSAFKVGVTSYAAEEPVIILPAVIASEGNVIIDDSVVDVLLDSQAAAGGKGIISMQDITICNASQVTSYVRSLTQIVGIYCEGNLKIDNANVDSEAISIDDDPIMVIALSSGKADINITDPKYKVRGKTNHGMAMGQHLRFTKEKVDFDPNYIVTNTNLTGDAVFLTPGDAKISTGSFLVNEDDHTIQVFETLYSLNNTTRFAEEVMIGTKGITPIVYEVTKQFGTFSGSGTVYAVIQGDRQDFQGLLLNDKAIDPKNYVVSNGSTVITLKEEYLKTLSKGNYKFRGIFVDGYADLALAVKLPTPPNPSTGNFGSMPTALFMALTVATFLGIVVLGYKFYANRAK
ncbi:MAG: hypothetical protein ACRCU3_02250 [Eubacteriaceae bacterium]